MAQLHTLLTPFLEPFRSSETGVIGASIEDYAEDLCDEDLAGASVDEIVEKCVGYEVEQRREMSMSDWSDEDLSEEQVSYACVDAYCAFLMGKNIRAWEL
ncbi:hypothetical protein TSUD_313770 [Trifolium subterraneum]|uniref:3'-5' exonuclease domain-containing protein n=1 Tax=Trifolium subterraneum TaxID=3900 RepID=A0A2Z6MTJ8_TRISU|nr:hypothetical protein TSUD_313770 [Trifolium subterraneum]